MVEATKVECQAAIMTDTGYVSTPIEPVEGSLASNEALQALREKPISSN